MYVFPIKTDNVYNDYEERCLRYQLNSKICSYKRTINVRVIAVSEFKGFEYDEHKTFGKGHGRIKKRSCYITEDIAWLFGKDRWKDLSSIGMAVYESTENDKKIVKRYFIYSIDADAKFFAKAVRSH